MKTRIQRRGTLKVLAAGLGTAALGSTGRALAQAAGPIRIGVVYPLSGGSASAGNASLLGVRIAVDQANRAGGVLGRQIEIVVRDDKATPAESALIAREFFGSGIRMVIGGLLAPNIRAIRPIVVENDGLMLIGSTQLPLMHEEFTPHIFRAQFSGRANLFGPASVLAQKYPNILRWATVSPDLEFGHANWATLQAGLKKYYRQNGGKEPTFLPAILHKFGATDYKVQINAVIDSGVEAVYVGGFGADSVAFASQARQLGMFEKVKVLVDSGSGTSVPKALGTNMPKVDFWSTTSWNFDDPKQNAVSRALMQAYTAITKDSTPEATMAASHSGMLVLLAAIRSAGRPDAPAVRTALTNVKVETALGPYYFRKEDNQAIFDIPVIRVAQKASAPGWEVVESHVAHGADVTEPPSPGKPHVEA